MIARATSRLMTVQARRCSTNVKPGVELMHSRYKDYANNSSLSNPHANENPTWLKRGAKDRAAFGLITVGVGVVVTALFLSAGNCHDLCKSLQRARYILGFDSASVFDCIEIEHS